MKRVLLSLLLAVGLLTAAPPAGAAIAVTNVGYNAISTTTTTLNITLTANVAIGDILWLSCGSGSGRFINSVSASGNVWTSGAGATSGTTTLGTRFSTVTVGLTSGGTVTVILNSTTSQFACALNKITGSDGADLAGTTATATNGAPGITTGSLAYDDEVVLGATLVLSASGGDTYTTDATFIEHTQNFYNAVTRLVTASRVLTGGIGTTVPRADTNSVSRTWITNYVTFKPTGALPPTTRRGALLGVFP